MKGNKERWLCKFAIPNTRYSYEDRYLICGISGAKCDGLEEDRAKCPLWQIIESIRMLNGPD